MITSIKNLNKTLVSNKFQVIGLTGKMASGKNYVCSELEKIGFVSVDCDVEVHKVLEEKKEKIISTFSDYAKRKNLSLKNPDGSLNRRNLGALLFQNPELLALHESIVYPTLTQNIKEKIEIERERFNTTRTGISNDAYISGDAGTTNDDCPATDAGLRNSTSSQAPIRGIIINATVLYKTPELLNKCDKIIFVQSNFITRFLRARKRDKMPLGQIKNRFLSQFHLKDRYKESGLEIITVRN